MNRALTFLVVHHTFIKKNNILMKKIILIDLCGIVINIIKCENKFEICK
jgi:hypothetical protein